MRADTHGKDCIVMDVRTSRYHEVYARSMRDPEGFWGEAAQAIDWYEPAKKVFDKDADNDGTGRRKSTFINAHARLRLFTGRNDPAGRPALSCTAACPWLDKRCSERCSSSRPTSSS